MTDKLRLLAGRGGSEYIQAATKLSLDELYEEANRLGKVEIGAAFRGRNATKINLRGADIDGDYISVRCDHHSDVKQNLAVCIAKARALIAFYKGGM